MAGPQKPESEQAALLPRLQAPTETEHPVLRVDPETTSFFPLKSAHLSRPDLCVAERSKVTVGAQTGEKNQKV